MLKVATTGTYAKAHPGKPILEAYSPGLFWHLNDFLEGFNSIFTTKVFIALGENSGMGQDPGTR